MKSIVNTSSNRQDKDGCKKLEYNISLEIFILLVLDRIKMEKQKMDAKNCKKLS